MISRKQFITSGLTLVAGSLIAAPLRAHAAQTIMTVNGPVNASDLGFTLSHEHALVDFIGAGQVSKSRYDQEEAFDKVLPYLQQAKKIGCETFIDCTPAYIGRDVELLRKLSNASGMHIITNTGYYGASGEKYYPAHVFKESEKQLATRWINEWKEGIEGTEIKPGFIKCGVDRFPLTSTQEKVLRAAAITHIETGLTIGVHTGDGKAALREMEILKEMNVHPSGWIWIHAQNEKDRNFHFTAARSGGWVSFDGFGGGNLEEYISFIRDMKSANLLQKVLLSHDAGWYQVGEPKGGSFRNYTAIFE
ncbi:MAG: hypothetical protein ABW174_12335, partial [Flavitalea sp.]